MKTIDTVGHTPGPWGRNGSLITAQGDMRLTVASLPCGEDRVCRFPDAAAKTFAAREANARLIAAAPELLAALVQIKRIGGTTAEAAIAAAAIAKATQP